MLAGREINKEKKNAEQPALEEKTSGSMSYHPGMLNLAVLNTFSRHKIQQQCPKLLMETTRFLHLCKQRLRTGQGNRPCSSRSLCPSPPAVTAQVHSTCPSGFLISIIFLSLIFTSYHSQVPVFVRSASSTASSFAKALKSTQ